MGVRGPVNRKPPNEVCFFGDVAVMSIHRRSGDTIYCQFDTTDYALVKSRRWCVFRGRHTMYVRSTEPRIFMHELITGEKRIDHKDGDGTNNRRSNLRTATLEQNGQNMRKRSDNSSGYKGVDQHQGRWRARIKVLGREVSLGGFDNPIAAAAAYDAAATKHFGEFAKLNFPSKGLSV